MRSRAFVSSLAGAPIDQVPDLPRSPGKPATRGVAPPPKLPLLAVAAGIRPSGAAFISSLLENGWKARESILPSVDDDPGRLMLLEAPERAEGAQSTPGAEEVLGRADVYVGLASAAWERRTLPLVAELGLPAVVASNGLEERDQGWLSEVSRRIPWILEPSFAMSVAWLRAKVHNPTASRSLVPTNRRIPASGVSGGVPLAVGPPGGELQPGTPSSGARMFPKLGSMLSDRAANTDGLAYSIEWLWARQHTLAPGRYRLAEMLESTRTGPDSTD